ncbi:hypothetical protein H8356DRAFT_918684, partial [Neocallimastix lanati (nom. inval.)]
FPFSDSVNLIFVLICFFDFYSFFFFFLILFLFLIMVLSFVRSPFKSLNVFSTQRNLNEYAIPTLFNSSSKEYKIFFWFILQNFASLVYSVNNKLRLSKYS